MKKLKLKSLIEKVTPLNSVQQAQIKGGSGSAHVNPLHESSSSESENPLFG